MNEIAALLRDFGQGASNAAASNVSGPVDLLAWALRKGGVPVPSNPILGSEWMRQKGLLADPRNKIAGLLGEAAGLSAPIAAAAKAPQIARGLLGADDALAAGANRLADHFENTGAAYRYDPKQRGSVGGFKYPQQEALDIAQRNAAKPVSEGGLGLPANNTPMDRAKAMGIDTEAFHGGTSDYLKIRKNKATPYGDRFFSTPDASYASEYAMGGAITGDTAKVKAWREANSNGAGANVMPLLLGEHKASNFQPIEFVSRPWTGSLGQAPQVVRSRFAAFDPARINENNLLAGALPFTYLADEDARNRLAEALKGPR